MPENPIVISRKIGFVPRDHQTTEEVDRDRRRATHLANSVRKVISPIPRSVIAPRRVSKVSPRVNP